MSKEYLIYENADGEQSAHTDTYSAKDGEKEIGRVEADSADKALRKFKRSGSDEQDDDTDAPRREATEDEKQDELAKAREEEESKQDFEVLADSKGNPYVAGEEGDPSKGRKSVAKAEPPPEPEESSLGTFRAKDAQEAIAKAKGEYRDAAEGPQRGAQTP